MLATRNGLRHALSKFAHEISHHPRDVLICLDARLDGANGNPVTDVGDVQSKLHLLLQQVLPELLQLRSRLLRADASTLLDTLRHLRSGRLQRLLALRGQLSCLSLRL